MNSIEAPDRSYTDNIRIGLDFIDVYMQTRNRKYLDKAEMIWKFAMAGMHISGGMYPSEKDRRSFNPLVNAYMAVFGARLFQATDNQDYLDMAKGLYLWAQENPSDKLSGPDGYGLMIQAGALLFRISERISYLEDARSRAAFCHEAFINKAGLDPWQQTLMIRGLIELYNTDGEPAYLNDIRKFFEQDQAGMAKTSLAEIYARLGAL